MKYQTLQSTIIITALLAAGEEFAIGECSCATLTKSIVRVGIYSLITLNLSDILASLNDLFATLEEYRFISQLYKAQGAIQSGRSYSYNDNFGFADNRRIVEMKWSRLLSFMWLSAGVSNMPAL